MIRKFLSRWHYRKSRFAHALAFGRVRKGDERQLWAWYRLGMYQSVVDAPVWCRSCRGLFAMAVSLCACGRGDEADAAAEEMASRPECRHLVVSLADALAPFVPERALGLLQNRTAPTSLRAALLLRLGDDDRAMELLRSAFDRGEMKKSPELYLYGSNADKTAVPARKLELLNAFFASFGLPPVVLRDPEKYPSTLNIRASMDADLAEGPLVSVIMTTFETGHRADIAIESVLRQSYRNIELIVVDDASRDDTPDVIRAWAARDERVKFISLEFNGGTYVAKNIGLQYANGEFVTCHDSDDWSHPLKIQKQVEPLLADSRLVATTSHWVRIQDDGLYYARPVHPLMRINPSSPLFRRKEVLRHAGIWECVRTGADSEFLARIRLVFGRQALRRIVQPLALGAHRNDSLMTSVATGYSESGISPKRLAYWEKWSKKHIKSLRRGIKPRYGVRKGESFEPVTMLSREIVISKEEAAKLLKEKHNVVI